MLKKVYLVALLVACTASILEAASLRSLGRDCDKKCPDHSVRKPHRNCYDTFDDCECIEGYAKYKGACVPCNFECPDYSIPKPHRKCYNNFGKFVK